jgi:hypothetical protein
MGIREVYDSMDVGLMSLANPETNTIIKRSAKQLKKRRWLKR